MRYDCSTQRFASQSLPIVYCEIFAVVSDHVINNERDHVIVRLTKWARALGTHASPIEREDTSKRLIWWALDWNLFDWHGYQRFTSSYRRILDFTFFDRTSRYGSPCLVSNWRTRVYVKWQKSGICLPTGALIAMEGATQAAPTFFVYSILQFVLCCAALPLTYYGFWQLLHLYTST